MERDVPLAPMSPFDDGPWPNEGEKKCLKIDYGFIRVLRVHY